VDLAKTYDAVRHAALVRACGREPDRKSGQGSFHFGDVVVHARVANSGRPQSVRFDINGENIRADFALWVYRNEDVYYLIPNAVLREIDCDPLTQRNHLHGFAIISLDIENDFASYKPQGGGRDVKEFKRAKLQDLIARLGRRSAVTGPQSNGEDVQWQARRVRQGQPAFREALLKAYESKCCITGTAPPNVVDAAHIEPYSTEQDCDPANGLLLRADLHNLFDDNLIAIHPETLEVHIHQSLAETEYRDLAGKQLRERSDGKRPDVGRLQARWEALDWM
jgi:hypothetical protein